MSTYNLCFWAEIRKIIYTPVNPSFTIWKWGLRGQHYIGMFSWCQQFGWKKVPYLELCITILVLKFKRISFTAWMWLKTAVEVADSVDPDEMTHSVLSDLRLNCLFKLVCPILRVNMVNCFSVKNICHRHSLEMPHWGTYNEFLQHIFLRRNKENIIIFLWKKVPEYLELGICRFDCTYRTLLS